MKKFLIILASSLSFISLGLSIWALIAVYQRPQKTISTIYNDAIHSVVELKCTTSDNTKISYGTAVFIENTKLITNAHVVSYKYLDLNMILINTKFVFRSKNSIEKLIK